MNREETIAEIQRLEQIKAIESEMALRASVQEPEIAQEKIDAGTYMGQDIPSGLSEFMLGADRRLRDVFTLGNADERQWDKQLDDSGYATAGEITADLGSMIAGGTALKSAQAIPKIGQGLAWLGQGLSAPKTVAQAGTAMGAYNAATNKDRLMSGATGAAGGALGTAIPKAIGLAIKPQITKGAKYLMDKGYPVTPGEMLGGMSKRVEERLTSVPFMGDSINAAKIRSLEGFSKATIDDALKPIGGVLPKGIKAGRPAIRQAGKQISEGYDDVLSKMDVTQDAQFVDDINKLVVQAEKLPKREQNKFYQVIEEKLMKQASNGSLKGEAFKKVDSGLRQEYKKAIKSQDNYVNDMGYLLKDAHVSLKNLGKRQNPELGNSLDLLDQSYAMMNRVEEAAGYSGARQGVFSPTHFLNAVKKNTSKKQFAKGGGYSQDVAEELKDLLVREIPDSGTAGRQAINLLGAASGLYTPVGVGAMAAGYGAYTPLGQKILQRTIARPESWQAGRQALEGIAPYTGLLGGASSR